jgi:hypothetical protein
MPLIVRCCLHSDIRKYISADVGGYLGLIIKKYPNLSLNINRYVGRHTYKKPDMKKRNEFGNDMRR